MFQGNIWDFDFIEKLYTNLVFRIGTTDNINLLKKCKSVVINHTFY